MYYRTETKLVDFLRRVINSGITQHYDVIGIFPQQALELLVEIMENEEYMSLGQFRVRESEYNVIIDFLKEGRKIQAIKTLKCIYGSFYSLLDYKRAVETIDNFPALKNKYSIKYN